jgi:PelA/Pel-15E family pectate lyase
MLLLSLILILSSPIPAVQWKDCLRQKPEWYGGPEALRIADNLLFYQREIGGWPKNMEMAKPLSEAERAELIDQKEQNDSTIDNGATYTQLIYLARIQRASGQERFRAAFIKGLDYLLAAQYANGGWPQYFPRLTGYYKHITFNDDAMIGVLTLLREIARKDDVYRMVDEPRRRRVEQAVAMGIDCILKTQIKVKGRLTAWCAQHDEITLAPAPARTYEKISLSGLESAGVVRFLMGIETPSPQVIRSIEAAVAWFSQARLSGVRVVEQPDSSPGAKGYDRVVIQDQSAGPLWARFYEIGSNRPIFCGRDGVIKYSLAEIEAERRNGYRWYVDSPAVILNREYSEWKKRTVNRN